MWRTILSYFVGENSDNDLSLDEAYNVLSKCTNNENTEVANNNSVTEDEEFSTYHKTGYITAIENNTYTIDNIYQFVSDNLNAAVGTNISYITYISNGKFKVSNVEIINSDWDSFVEVSNRKWCTRILACKVINKSMRDILVEPGNVKINLNEVSAEFVPVVGDWLEIDVKCEIDESIADLNGNIIEVNKISPLRIKQISGIIKQWDKHTQTGVIDKNISFSKESLSQGYIPFVGDRIITEAIESDQAQCSWRSLKVVPDLTVTKNELKTVDTEDFTEHVEGLFISNICITSNTVNEVQPFTVDIQNKCEEDLILLDVKFSSSNSQCSINKQQDLKNLTVPANSSVKLECKCNVKSYGRTRELMLFVFKDFTIGRWVTITLEAKVSEEFRRGRYSSQNYSRQTMHNNVLQGDYLRGQRPVLPPRFISNKLPEYKVPQKLVDFVVRYSVSFRDTMALSNEIQQVKPSLRSLNFNTYEDFFHTLIHLEEIANMIAVKQYDQEKACFIQNGEYLMLEIENLSERRPSLIVGDRVVARDPYNANSYELEGFIHKVGAKHVYIKFGQVFHEMYKGEDYQISVVCSRTTYRKRHQAVGLAIRNLGKEILFPSKVQLQSPQLDFTYDKYADELQSVENKSKDCGNNFIKDVCFGIRGKTPENNVNRNKRILASLQKIANKENIAITDVSKKTEGSVSVEDTNGISKLLLPVEEETKTYRRYVLHLLNYHTLLLTL